MAPAQWPNSRVEYLKSPKYQNKELKQKVITLSKERYQGYLNKTYKDKDLICCNYDPSAASSKVKIKSLKNFPNHPAYPYYGLFSTKTIPANTLIIKYCGFVSTGDDYDKSSDYVLNFLNAYSVDADKMGNEARYANDYRNIGPKPLVAFKEFYDLNTHEVCMGIFSLNEPIASNQELLINYGKSFWKSRNLLMQN